MLHIKRNSNIRVEELDIYFVEFHDFLDKFKDEIYKFPRLNLNNPKLELYDCIEIQQQEDILYLVLQNNLNNGIFVYQIPKENFNFSAANLLTNLNLKYTFIWDELYGYTLYVVINNYYMTIYDFMYMIKNYHFRTYY